MQTKSVLVTGAGGGLGTATVDAFLAAGAHVHAVELDPSSAAQAKRRWAGSGERADVVRLDVRQESSVVEYVDSLKKLDVLVNNAGIARKRPFLETPSEEFDAIHEVNLRSAFVVMRQAALKMRQHGGHIINIVSDSGMLGIRHMAAYAASKHGLLGLSRSARLELREHHIRVTAVCPGSISTDIFGPGRANPAAMSPKAVASLIVYLAQMPPEIEVQEILLEPMSLVEERYLRS